MSILPKNNGIKDRDPDRVHLHSDKERIGTVQANDITEDGLNQANKMKRLKLPISAGLESWTARKTAKAVHAGGRSPLQ